MASVKKVDIANRLYQKLGGIKKDSIKYVETFFDTVKELVNNGEDVKLHRFGKFTSRQKKARKGRNPATGETIILGARRVVSFKASGKLKEAVKSALGKRS